MNNLNANASAFLWQTAQPQTLPPQSVQQQPQSVPPQAQLLHGAVVSQPRKFGGNKSNYNYVQTQAGAAMMGAANPGGGPMGALGGNPNVYRKRQPINAAFNAGCYQSNGKRYSQQGLKA